MTTFSLKDVREKLKYSQVVMAKDLGVNQTYLSNIENGSRKISIELLQKLYKKYSISADWVINGVGDVRIMGRALDYDRVEEQQATYTTSIDMYKELVASQKQTIEALQARISDLEAQLKSK